MAKVTRHASEPMLPITGQTKRWPARYTLVGLCFCAAFVCYIDRVNISVAIIAMQEEFAWSETLKGLVLSSFFIGYMVFQIPSGYLANRYGGKIVLAVAVTWWSLATLITPIAAAASLPALIAVRIAMGLGEAAMFPAAYNLFGRWVPPPERSRAVSLMLTGIPAGTLFALSTTGWLVSQQGWPSVFYIFGTAGFVWVIAWFAKAHNDPARHPRISAQERALLMHARSSVSGPAVVPWRRLFTSTAIWALVINHFCSNWALYMLLAWLPSYFKAQGLSITSAGLFSAAPWLTMFVMINIAGWIADAIVQRGRSLTFVRKTMQATGLLCSAAFLFFAPGADSATAALILMCGALGMLAFTWSGFMPNHLDIAPRYADVLMGVTNTAGTVPGIVGVVITGWLVDLTGTYTSAFALAAAINVCGALVWLGFSTAKPVVESNE